MMVLKSTLDRVLALALVTFVNGQSITISAFADVANAKASYTAITISSMAVPAGQTLDLSGLKTGTTVTFTGTTTFGYSEWVGPLVKISGTDVTVQGSGILDGNGALYWDGSGGSGGVVKPKFFQVRSMNGNSKITGITLKNTPVQAFSLGDSNGLLIDGITHDNKAGDALGKNTDTFDINNMDGLTINGCFVYNQDDCTAINSGTNIVVSNMYCSGGHGLSIGSVGGRTNNLVQNILFKDSTVTGGSIGVRIKTNVGTTGLVDQVTYSNIKLIGITKYGVILEQDYDGGDAKGTPDNGVPITNLVLSGITGTVTSAGRDYYIMCGTGSCSGWTFSNVVVTGGGKASTCNYTPSGFSCTTGAPATVTTIKASSTTLKTSSTKASTTTLKTSTTTIKTSSTTSSTKASTNTIKTSSTTSSTKASTTCTTALYGQCGGVAFTGCTVCASGSTCKYSSDYYSQCL